MRPARGAEMQVESDDLLHGPSRGDGEIRPHLSSWGSFRRMRRSVVLATATVSLVPLAIMTWLYHHQYERVFRAERVQPISRLTAITRQSIEYYLSERRSALDFIVHDRAYVELCDSAELARLFHNFNRSMKVGAFVDLGLIDAEGDQLCYAGSYRLEGHNYRDQPWFDQVLRRGIYVSDVFLGHRKSPHFVIAIRHEHGGGEPYVLRATIDAEMLAGQVHGGGLLPSSDVFLVNRKGVLQTASRRYGPVLDTMPLPLPPATDGIDVVEQRDPAGELLYVGYAFVEDSPFVVVFVQEAGDAMGRWFALRTELLGFMIVSSVLILGVIWWGSNQFVLSLREANRRRAALFHEVEYSNKLASIGRLAAGVAHEINNPLAIINEKAGLLRDLLSLDGDFPKREKVLGLVDSVLASVERCSTVTHRLLGFARHMHVSDDAIDLHALLREVLGFLAKEAEHRNLDVSFPVPGDVPTIESDRGQLQQVFLNLLNNAFAAVSDGGGIEIHVERVGDDRVAVRIADDGCGIPRANIERIFEPFFTTKEGSGTGLGLSITYGIVRKLGGTIEVESEVGSGTRFTVVLPVRRRA